MKVFRLRKANHEAQNKCIIEPNKQLLGLNRNSPCFHKWT